MVAQVFYYRLWTAIIVALMFCQVAPTIAQVNEGAAPASAIGEDSVAGQDDDANAPDEVSKNSELETHSELVSSVNSMDRVLSGQPEPSEVLRQRLFAVGFSVGLVLALLATLFGYLRMDHATRGFHSGRLQMAALGIVGLILVAGYFLWAHLLFK